jgi:hypothetical protein
MFYLVLLNNIMNKTTKLEIQNAYRELLGRYEAEYEYAATLTLKQSTTITTTDKFGYVRQQRIKLSKTALDSTKRYFAATLTRYLYGNAAKHKSTRDAARPMLVFVDEGLNSDSKRVHLHIALGNVPKHKQADIAQLIKKAWAQCDFAYRQVDIKQIYDAKGWTDYITKELSFENTEAVDIVNSVLTKRT